MSVPLLAVPPRRWACPNCTFTDVTKQAEPHTRFHPCAGLGGFSAPMVPAGTKAKVVAEERQDYIGAEDVQTTSEGRPIMAIRTTRNNGEDLAVYAPTAHSGGNA